MKRDDYLYTETDDSCGLCGLRGEPALTVHHIDGNSANDVYENMIVLCYNCHMRYNQQKGITEDEIRVRKRHLMHRTVTTYGVNALKIAARNDFGVVAMPFLLYHLIDLGFMSKEEDQMGYGAQSDATARFAITDRGRVVLAQWLED